ncbi:MAG: hypothetical protein ACRC31_07265 [Cetobacterium sp.]|uniref:hypothetical protein n=1 Tax=Cetobacterium TaxID=180162 RepID=UPI001F05757E|nr:MULTISPECIES: hypothetical protein [Cetobacterium]UPO97611.1 hypothetical protein MKD34_01855 [Cetobacterium somerae]WVJ00525.1 hypothetical protein VSU16_06800 [Cetobacterium somerae]
MEIFINGEKINIGIKNTKLLNVLEKIEANVIKDGEVIVELKLDGEMVDGKSLPLNKKVKVLELTTRSHREILIESLYLLEPYSDRFFENLSEIEEEMSDIGKLIEMVSFVEWVFGIVLSLKEATAIDLIYSDYNEYVEEFKKYAEEIFEAFKKEDFVGIIEVLEGAIVPLLEDLLANSKDYLKEVLKEESRKKLLN